MQEDKLMMNDIQCDPELEGNVRKMSYLMSHARVFREKLGSCTFCILSTFLNFLNDANVFFDKPELAPVEVSLWIAGAHIRVSSGKALGAKRPQLILKL